MEYSGNKEDEEAAEQRREISFGIRSVSSEMIQATQSHQSCEDELRKCLTAAECVLCHREPSRREWLNKAKMLVGGKNQKLFL